MADMASVGFGTYALQPSEAKDAILAAFKVGYTHFDLALLYENEPQIGEAFKEYFKDHDRSKYFITTKLWNTNHRPENVAKQLKSQLQHLNLDYVDLFIIHWPINAVHGTDPNPQRNGETVVETGFGLRDTWRAMEALADQKLTRFIGVSNFCVQLLQDMLSYSRIPPFCNQFEVNLEFQNSTLVQFCLQNHIKVVAYRPIGGPQLAQLLQNPVLLEMASKYQKTIVQIILKWHFQKYNNSKDYAVIPKTSSQQRMKENLLLDFEIDQKDMNQLNNMDKNNRICTAKWGIPVFD